MCCVVLFVLCMYVCDLFFFSQMMWITTTSFVVGTKFIRHRQCDELQRFNFTGAAITPQRSTLTYLCLYIPVDYLIDDGDHANKFRRWDDIHPASAVRQIAALQLHGSSDYTAETNSPLPRRGVSSNAPCRICFQPGKDVMVRLFIKRTLSA